MLRVHKHLTLVALFVGAAILVAPGEARATFQLRITTTGGFSATVTDNLAGDASGLSGVITFVGSAGNFTVTVATSLSKPAQGSATLPNMDLNVVVAPLIPLAVAETITISASDQDYGPLPTSGTFTMTTGGTLASGVTFSYTASQDTANANFGSTSSKTLGPTSTSPFALSGQLPVVADTNYSLTQTVSFAYGAGGSGASSADSTLFIPAPGGLLLALTAAPVLGIGSYLRRRRITYAA